MVEEADAAHAEGWSAAAAGWSESWGTFARPVQDALIDAARIAPGSRVLDVGCGTGEFLARLRHVGADATGVDPAAGMRAIAIAKGFDVRRGDAEDLPFADASFDVVTAVNAVQFAEDITGALREFARVLRSGGRIALASWAEGERNDIDVIEHAVAEADGSEPLPDGPLRAAGGLEGALAEAGIRAGTSGLVAMPWRAAGEDALVRGILLGEDPATLDELHPIVVAAAAPFRSGDGYLLRNAFRWAVAQV